MLLSEKNLRVYKEWVKNALEVFYEIIYKTFLGTSEHNKPS